MFAVEAESSTVGWLLAALLLNVIEMDNSEKLHLDYHYAAAAAASS